MLAHWCIAFIEYPVLQITFPTKQSVVMAIKYAKFTFFMVIVYDKDFNSVFTARLAVKLGSVDEKNLNRWKINRTW